MSVGLGGREEAVGELELNSLSPSQENYPAEDKKHGCLQGSQSGQGCPCGEGA